MNAGEDPATGILAGITCNPGGSTLITCVEDERLEFQVSILQLSLMSCTRLCPCLMKLRHVLTTLCQAIHKKGQWAEQSARDVAQDGMEVTFSEVVGMEELNDGRPRKVKNCKVSRFINCD